MGNIYYTYIYVDPRYPCETVLGVELPGQPFYVGKGKNKRAWTHLTESAHRTKNFLKHQKIQRIKNDGHTPIIIFIQENIFENQAFDLERKFIAEIGTKWTIEGINRGPLCNMTSGGDGATPSDELKLKYRHVGKDNGMWGRTHTEEVRQRISEFRKQFKHSSQTKQQMTLLRNSEKNPHNQSWIICTPQGRQIKTNYLKEKCDELRLKYNSLYSSYKNNKPISRGKYKGYRLIKVTN